MIDRTTLTVGALALALGVLLAVAWSWLRPDPEPPAPRVIQAAVHTGRAEAHAEAAEQLVPDSVASARQDSAYHAGATRSAGDLARARAEVDRLGDALLRLREQEPDAQGRPTTPTDDREPVRTPADVSADTSRRIAVDLVAACAAERSACDRRDSLRLGRIAALGGQRDSLRGAYDLARRALGDMTEAATLLQAAHGAEAARAARYRTQRDLALGVAAASGVALVACLTVLDC